MKYRFLYLLIFFLIFACNTTSKNNNKEIEKIIFKPQDKEILEEIFELFSEQKNTTTPELMVKVGIFLKETPYVAHTLETEPEQLVVNLRELDCTTFVENCLAISRTIKSGENTFEKFTSELLKIRYRSGKIEDYTSRIHYFSDWIYTNEQKNLVDDIAKEIAETTYELNVDFMSTHPESYAQLKENSEFVKTIANQENEINTREMFYIPKNKISEYENILNDGDIVGITTSIKGLDISHVVLLIQKKDRIHILHASTVEEKVVISDNTLDDYLQNNKSVTGIMVARPF